LSTNSFEECLVATVNQGGDADTTGAIAGAIAGAYMGWSRFRHWVAKLARPWCVRFRIFPAICSNARPWTRSARGDVDAAHLESMRSAGLAPRQPGIQRSATPIEIQGVRQSNRSSSKSLTPSTM